MVTGKVGILSCLISIQGSWRVWNPEAGGSRVIEVEEEKIL